MNSNSRFVLLRIGDRPTLTEIELPHENHHRCGAEYIAHAPGYFADRYIFLNAMVRVKLSVAPLDAPLGVAALRGLIRYCHERTDLYSEAADYEETVAAIEAAETTPEWLSLLMP